MRPAEWPSARLLPTESFRSGPAAPRLPSAPTAPEAYAAFVAQPRPAQGARTGEAIVQETGRDIARFIEQGTLGGTSAAESRWLALRAVAAVSQLGPAGTLPSTPVHSTARPFGPGGDAVASFLERIGPFSRRAAASLGVAPELVQAHAALESGWGRRPLITADSQDSHNLFALKAGGGWKGEVLHALTTEYVDGEPSARTEPFRRYGGLSEAFDDYVRLLTTSPRYQSALNVGADAAAFARGLAAGGYATDPQYAGKLERLATQLLQRAR
jgi:peptidoglycan hydrolase FlgJ